MDSGFMDLSIYCVEMAPKWSNALDSQPRQGKEMSVQAYYDEFCIWKEKMEELNYLADEKSYVDDFLYGLKWDIAVRVWSYESKPQKLSVAFYWARIEESIIEIKALFAATSEPISMVADKLLASNDSYAGSTTTSENPVDEGLEIGEMEVSAETRDCKIAIKQTVGTQHELEPPLIHESVVEGLLVEETTNGSAIGSPKTWVAEVTSDLKVVFSQNDIDEEAHEVFDEMPKLFSVDSNGETCGRFSSSKIEILEIGHHLFERMPELNNRAAVHGELVLPRDLSYGTEVTMGSFSISFKSMFEKVSMFLDNTIHEFDADCWVDGILTFMFDPGGSTYPLIMLGRYNKFYIGGKSNSISGAAFEFVDVPKSIMSIKDGAWNFSLLSVVESDDSLGWHQRKGCDMSINMVSDFDPHFSCYGTYEFNSPAVTGGFDAYMRSENVRLQNLYCQGNMFGSTYLYFLNQGDDVFSHFKRFPSNHYHRGISLPNRYGPMTETHASGVGYNAQLNEMKMSAESGASGMYDVPQMVPWLFDIAAIDIAFVDRAVAIAVACFSIFDDDVITIRYAIFSWDPGPWVVLLYILEDKDVFKRVGKKMILMNTILVLVQTEWDNSCQVSLLFYSPAKLVYAQILFCTECYIGILVFELDYAAVSILFKEMLRISNSAWLWRHQRGCREVVELMIIGKKSMWVAEIFVQESYYGYAIVYTITSAISMRAIQRSNCFHKKGHNAPCQYGENFFMLLFGLIQVVFSQIPNFHDMDGLSVIAAVMSFAYTFIGLALGFAAIIDDVMILIGPGKSSFHLKAWDWNDLFYLNWGDDFELTARAFFSVFEHLVPVGIIDVDLQTYIWDQKVAPHSVPLHIGPFHTVLAFVAIVRYIILSVSIHGLVPLLLKLQIWMEEDEAKSWYYSEEMIESRVDQLVLEELDTFGFNLLHFWKCRWDGSKALVFCNWYGDGELCMESGHCSFSYHHLEDKAVVEGKDLSCSEVEN